MVILKYKNSLLMVYNGNIKIYHKNLLFLQALLENRIFIYFCRYFCFLHPLRYRVSNNTLENKHCVKSRNFT